MASPFFTTASQELFSIACETKHPEEFLNQQAKELTKMEEIPSKSCLYGSGTPVYTHTKKHTQEFLRLLFLSRSVKNKEALGSPPRLSAPSEETLQFWKKRGCVSFKSNRPFLKKEKRKRKKADSFPPLMSLKNSILLFARCQLLAAGDLKALVATTHVRSEAEQWTSLTGSWL